MATLKEYKIYLKVKKFIETEGCNEAELIPPLINGVSYVPLVTKSNDMEPTKFYFLSGAARACEVPKQKIIYAYGNRCTRIARIQWLD